MTARRSRSWAAERLLERRFAVLLAALVFLFVVQPMLPRAASGMSVVHADIVLAVVLLAGVWTLSHRKELLLASAFLVLPATALSAFAHAGASRYLALASLACAIAFAVLATVVVLWHVLRQAVVDFHTILGAICAYLLIGLTWALIYSMIARVLPQDFALASGAALPLAEDPGGLLVSGLLNYSLFTLGTIGPQNIVPVGHAALTWTGIEAITGQLYLAVLIARLVGQHAARSS